MIYTDENISYQEAVKKLLEERSTLVFSNGMYIHAQAIYAEFLNYAKSTFNLVCTCLSATVFDSKEIATALRNAIDRGVKVNIITERQPEQSATLEIIQSFLGTENSPSIYTSAQAEQEQKFPYNFCTIDSRAYRFEEDPDKINAIVCANDRDFASKLDSLFNGLIKGAE